MCYTANQSAMQTEWRVRMFDDFRELQRRKKAYWYADGLWEAFIGLVYLLMGGVTALLVVSPRLGSILYSILIPGMILVPILGSKVVQALKSRWVWPHTGSVIPETFSRQSLKRGILLFFIVALAGSLAFIKGEGRFALSYGLAALGVWGYLGYEMGLRRFYALAALAFAWALALLRMELPNGVAEALFWAGVGALFLTSGLMSWMRWRIQTAKLREERDDA